MKRANIYFKGRLAGILCETDSGYMFRYNKEYLEQENPQAVSKTLPLSDKEYYSNILFPFFDGLIPEGWLLDVAIRNTNISILDRMSLLLLCCKDCIGAVSVEQINDDENE